MENVKEEKTTLSKKSVITLIVFTIVLGILAITFCVLYAVDMTKLEQTSINLENIYQRTFYDLVDNVNNTEIKMSKLLASTDNNYSNELLFEINDNLTSAQNQLSYLPISINGIGDTTKFINQFGGYTATLAKNTKSGKTLTAEERAKLRELYNSIYGIKIKLNQISTKINQGYNISDNANPGKEEYNKFTQNLKQIKNNNQDYPSMIYDGPFSDSTCNKEIKGLNFDEISKQGAEKIAKEIFKNADVQFANETNGKFQTYDFNIMRNDLNLYVQITKKGGKLLTISSKNNKNAEKISHNEAIKIAEDFVSNLGISNMKCVWTDKIQSDVYLNLAPVIDDVIIYPDLIKVKVDLDSGSIVGYEACSYYTNHVERNLQSAKISQSVAKSKIDSKYKIETIKLALSPIEYKGEILTYEFKCKYQGSTYYIFINAITGVEENILKVIETQNGNLLM